MIRHALALLAILLAINFSSRPLPLWGTPRLPVLVPTAKHRQPKRAVPARHHPRFAVFEVSRSGLTLRLTFLAAKPKAYWRLQPREAASRHHVDTARPDDAPNPSIRASVPSIAESRAFTSCNQE